MYPVEKNDKKFEDSNLQITLSLQYIYIYIIIIIMKSIHLDNFNLSNLEKSES